MKNRFFNLAAFIFAAFFTASLSIALPAQAQSSLNAQQKKEVQDLIGDYIKQHPEVILQSIRSMQERERGAEKQRGLNNLVTYRELITNDPTSPVGGNPKGDVTIVEFFDYNCGYCKRVYPTLKKLMAEDKNLRVVFKEFPILSAQSELAARAALATWRQDKSKYAQIHEEFITLRGGFTESRILRIAGKLGLDLPKLKKDMRSSTMNKIIMGNRQLAQQLGITGTPGFIVGDQIIPGAVDLQALKELVAKARKG